MSRGIPETDYDLLIIGAGMAGASLVCALRGQPLRIGLIEANAFGAETQPGFDARTTALSFGTRRIFEGMQLWRDLSRHATPIRKIHVSDRGHFGFTHLGSAEHGLEALGYVVENALLGRVFAEAINTLDNIELICPARVDDIVIADESARLSVQAGDNVPRTLTARLVVLADGRKSAVRERLGIQTNDSEYGQSAVIANITPEFSHQNVAYERFTQDGPLALLPMSDNRCSVVWTTRAEQRDALLALNDADFLSALQNHFGWRLGRLCYTGARSSYPLALMQTQELVRHRLALIGNAAHTLHPIAGQGFNLGLRDVAALAQVLAEAMRAGQDIGDRLTLNKYSSWRTRDQRRVTRLTDTLVRVFTSDFAPLESARNLGMLALDSLPFMKDALVKQGIGLTGRQPRLARGLSL